MHFLSSAFTDTDFKEICVMIFYKSSPLPQMCCNPSCTPLLPADRLASVRGEPSQ